MGDGPAKTQDEQPGGQRREDIGQGRQGMGQVIAERAGHARIIHCLANGGEAADQPQRTEGLMAKDVQGAMAMRAVKQRKGDDADRRETGTHHQGIRQHHGHRFAQ
ncbi:hypothetical protein D9M73_241590 [compost metagenome]